MKSAVSISRCESYADFGIALQHCLAPLGGMASFVRPGARVLLKANLVSACPESRAVTTASAAVAAVAHEVKAAGGFPSVGDSPALVSANVVANRCGIAGICQQLNMPVVDLDEPIQVTHRQAKSVRAFRISRRLSEFDVIINLPKLKTHCLLGLTGAVKNMFGCIPGKLKTAHHLTQSDPLSFAQMLLDLHGAVTPQLTIVDAVIGMEGPGPGAGDPRQFGLIVAGVDAVAVDAVCAKILGFAEHEVPTVSLARRNGVSGATLENIQVFGERIEDAALCDVKKPRASITTYVPQFVMQVGKRALMAKPEVVGSNCVLCGDCARICAPEAIALSARAPKFDDHKCIRCYCCQEVCPAGAIVLKRGLLSRWLGQDSF